MSQTNPDLITQLVDAGVLDGDDLDLTDEFRADWRRRIKRIRGAGRESYLGLLIEADPDEISLDVDYAAAIVATESRIVGEWPSTAAVDADVAAFATLGEWFPAWNDLTGAERDELAARLRAFLRRCPACDGPLEREPVGLDLPRVWCESCDAQLLPPVDHDPA